MVGETRLGLVAKRDSWICPKCRRTWIKLRGDFPKGDVTIELSHEGGMVYVPDLDAEFRAFRGECGHCDYEGPAFRFQWSGMGRHDFDGGWRLYEMNEVLNPYLDLFMRDVTYATEDMIDPWHYDLLHELADGLVWVLNNGTIADKVRLVSYIHFWRKVELTDYTDEERLIHIAEEMVEPSAMRHGLAPLTSWLLRHDFPRRGWCEADQSEYRFNPNYADRVACLVGATGCSEVTAAMIVAYHFLELPEKSAWAFDVEHGPWAATWNDTLAFCHLWQRQNTSLEW